MLVFKNIIKTPSSEVLGCSGEVGVKKGGGGLEEEASGIGKSRNRFGETLRLRNNAQNE